MDIQTILSIIPIILIVGLLIIIFENIDRVKKEIVGVSIITIIIICTVINPIIADNSKEDLDIYVVAGQSNAAYLHYDLEDSSPVPISGTTFYYGTEEKPIAYGSHNTPSYDLSFESYSIIDYNNNLAHLEGPFSAIYHEKTGKKVLTINVGISGTTIQEWQKEGFAWLYANEVINHAINDIDTSKYHVKKMGYIWIQGESNSSMTKEDYESLFMNTYQLFNKKGFDNCFISKVRCDPSTTGQRNPIGPSEAQIELAGKYSKIHMATTISDSFTITNGKMKDDNLHYSQLGQNEVGIAVAEYCSDYFY